jgi:CheY-like chemotaxis protein
MLDLVFDRFAQAGPEVSRKFGGTGLGLAISKEIVELMGGEIGVDSIAGQGSRFWCVLDLPVAVAPERREPEAPEASARPLNVLVADDNEANRELIGTLVRAMGHEVDVVADGCAAVEAVRDGGYDLVLMDVHMPRMDGLAATRAIRLIPSAAARTPIIALTANVLPDQIAFYRASGMDDHVGKPIDPRELLLKIALWSDGRSRGQASARDGWRFGLGSLSRRSQSDPGHVVAAACGHGVAAASFLLSTPRHITAFDRYAVSPQTFASSFGAFPACRCAASP